MSELKKLVTQRKVIRGRVTTCYNRSGSYDTLSKIQRATELANLLGYKEDIKNFNDLIQNIKYSNSDDTDDDELESEMESCADYNVKIQECIVILNSLSDSLTIGSQFDAARSLLKQPVAPLPVFSGNEDEDLLKFIKE